FRTTEFSARARRRLQELLDSAERRFAGRPEIRFWKQYITAADAGRALAPAECMAMMRERPEYLEPAFVVFSHSAGQEAERDAMRPPAGCAERPTARGRHVISVISAALRKQRWARNAPV